MNRSSHTSMHPHSNSPHYHEQQHQHHHHQREFVEHPASPPMPSPSYQRSVNPPQHGHGNNDMGQYRSYGSQPQQHQSMHPQQQSYSRDSYQSSHQQQQHHQNPPSKQEDHQFRNIPIIQSSDPSFTQRPHSRSFSSGSQSHPYSHYPLSNPPPPQHHQHPHHQPRLHHSISAGHLPVAGNRSAPIIGSMVPSGVPGSKHGIGTAVAPKKKDPYATAWRTYSKIAEELNLLNPDGTLYPISKDAILKYLRHQSKRIKSSNLHWYVNGLKKHQENLGFAWDDVRYDEQVVALLKELTVHPTATDNGGGMAGYHPARSSISHTAPIDNAKIASLSNPSNPHSQHYAQQQQKHQSYSTSFASSPKRYPQDYEETATQSHSYSRQQQYSERIEPPLPQQPKRAPFHSAPIQLPSQRTRDDRSAPETPQSRYKGHSQVLGDGSPGGSTSTTSSPMSSSEIQPIQQSPSSMSNGSHIKRKRHDVGSERLAHLVSPKSLEGGELDENETNSRADNMDTNALEDMDEDHRERTPLKRHASTGTLRSQARMSALTAISPDGQQDYPVTTPSPGPRDNESGGHFRWGTSETSIQNRLSPPGSITSSAGSPSSASRPVAGGSSSSSYGRHRRANGVVSSPISVASIAASSSNVPPLPQQSSTSGSNSNKTTVQFSDVVEYAQQLQTKYGNRCKSHPWGCVELTEDYHLELTIKMYMDWAGLVASGRLTMDEIPDLPEFRHPGSSSSSSNSLRSDISPSSPSPTPGPSAVVGGILKRMTSTPLTTTFSSFSLSQNQPLSPILKSEDQSSEAFNTLGQFTFEHEGGRATSSSTRQRQRSMSGSPPIYGQSPKREGFISDSLMSRIGSLPPQHKIPSLPTPKASGSAEGDSSSGGGSNAPPPASPLSVSARARARRMVSSPSLSQQFSFSRFQRDSGFSSPPQAPPPPVPSLPLSYTTSETSRRSHPDQTVSQKTDISYNSTGSSPPSEDMDLSGDETPDSMVRTPTGSVRGMQRRDVGMHAREEMENEDVFERRVQETESSSVDREGRHYHHLDAELGHDQFEEDDASASVETVENKEVSRSGGRDLAQWQHESRHRERNDNASSYDYATPNVRVQSRQTKWNTYTDDNQSGRDRDSDEEMGSAKDFDRVEEVRRGIKSLQSSLSLKPHSLLLDKSVDGPANSNADPIATVEMTIVPKLQARTQPDQRKQQSHSGQGYDASAEGNGEDDEAASMMET
ncbi:hypothetical protein BGX27_000584 [Mortierella sp. AM989]|nr:hypothetical protein BGX27_000584 [Mortierella sp. AM989]